MSNRTALVSSVIFNVMVALCNTGIIEKEVTDKGMLKTACERCIYV